MLEKKAAWAESISGLLIDPPCGNQGGFLETAGKEATAAGFTLLQSQCTGGEPPQYSLAGFGEYADSAAFLRSLGNKPYLLTKRLELEKRNDGKIRTSCEVTVRSGPWEGPGGDGVSFPEPFPDLPTDAPLGQTNLFKEEIPHQEVTIPRPNIKYVGYYEMNASLTLMLEIDQKSALAVPGDVLGGIEVLSATKTEIRVRRNPADEWVVRLEEGPR